MKRVLKGVLLLLGLGVALWVGHSIWNTGDAPSTETEHFTIAAYNLNFGLESDPATLEALTAIDADIILLQETTPVWEQRIRARLETEFPFQQYVGSDYPAGGSGIISRLPLSEFTSSPSAIGWFPAVKAIATTPQGPVQVIGVHLKPPVADSGGLVVGYFTTGPEREEEMHAHLDALYDPELPTVFAGDFNEQSGGGLEVLLSRGFADAIDRFAPGENTWRMDVGLITLGQQLDHIAHNGRLSCLEARIIESGRSDHLPIVARFRFE